jgi:hypothetical protein
VAVSNRRGTKITDERASQTSSGGEKRGEGLHTVEHTLNPTWKANVLKKKLRKLTAVQN